MGYLFLTTLVDLTIGSYAHFVNGKFETDDPVVADKVRRSVSKGPLKNIVVEPDAVKKEAREQEGLEPPKRKRGRPPKTHVGMRTVATIEKGDET